jgi:hypothetical protein
MATHVRIVGPRVGVRDGLAVRSRLGGSFFARHPTVRVALSLRLHDQYERVCSVDSARLDTFRIEAGTAPTCVNTRSAAIAHILVFIKVIFNVVDSLSTTLVGLTNEKLRPMTQAALNPVSVTGAVTSAG